MKIKKFTHQLQLNLVKLMFTVAAIFISANLSFGQQKGTFDDLIVDGNISSQMDTYGSTIDAVGNFVVAKQFLVNYDLVANTGGTLWPWVDVECVPKSKSFVGLTGITLTYQTSDIGVRIVLDEPDLSGGTSFMYTLPQATTWSTITVQLAQFAQPTWVTPAGTLDLTKVNILQFTPTNISLTAKTTGSIGVKSLELLGLSAPVGINNFTEKADGINIYSLGTKSVNIISSQSDKCVMNIYSIDGKLIYNSNVNLAEGMNTVGLNSSLANGTYIVRLISNDNVTVKKIAIIK